MNRDVPYAATNGDRARQCRPALNVDSCPTNECLGASFGNNNTRENKCPTSRQTLFEQDLPALHRLSERHEEYRKSAKSLFDVCRDKDEDDESNF
jgi:hypothetical protein